MSDTMKIREFSPIEIRREKCSVIQMDGDSLTVPEMEKYDSTVIYYYDEVLIYPKIERGLKLDKSRLMEARFFSRERELYIRRLENEEIIARVIIDNDKTDNKIYAVYECYDELHKIVDRRRAECGASHIRVRNYFTNEGELELVDYRFVSFESVIDKEGGEDE